MPGTERSAADRSGFGSTAASGLAQLVLRDFEPGLRATFEATTGGLLAAVRRSGGQRGGESSGCEREASEDARGGSAAAMKCVARVRHRAAADIASSATDDARVLLARLRSHSAQHAVCAEEQGRAAVRPCAGDPGSTRAPRQRAAPRRDDAALRHRREEGVRCAGVEDQAAVEAAPQIGCECELSAPTASLPTTRSVSCSCDLRAHHRRPEAVGGSALHSRAVHHVTTVVGMLADGVSSEQMHYTSETVRERETPLRRPAQELGGFDSYCGGR